MSRRLMNTVGFGVTRCLRGRRARVRWWLWGLTTAFSALIGWLPLFGGFTYEYGLAIGIAVPLLVAAAVAWELSGSKASATRLLVEGAQIGAQCWALTALVALLHGLRAGFCDLIGEFSHYFVATALGVVAAGVWGGCVAAGARGHRRRWLLVVVALALPLSSMLFSFWRYYDSPIIFAFDHFVGFFAGTLYDTELQGMSRLLSYRLATLGWIGTAIAGSRFVRWTRRGMKVTWRRRWGALMALSCSFGIASAVTLAGPALGHYQTTASVAEQLGGDLRSQRCRIIYDAAIQRREVQALARECDAHVHELERFFEVDATPPITVFLFADSNQKAWLMGARNVYIAKPWRREIYIQRAGFPHPVLRHELAHVVAASFARGPFKVAGPLGGWVPDPGRIEGVAVAAAPSENDVLTLLQWAAAMQRLDLLPALRSVFRLSFLGENASSAYTVAGAFVEWLRQMHGIGVVRQWYQGEDLERLTARTWAELERSFSETLAGIELEPAELSAARARFDRPGVFGRRCPHQVDERLVAAQRALGQGDIERACEGFKAVLDLDEQNIGALLGRGRCQAHSDEVSHAIEYFFELARRQREHPLRRAWALEAAADEALRLGRDAQALEGYQRASEHIVDEDHLRQLDIKRYAASLPQSELGRQAMIALLLGEPERGTDWAVSAALLGQWSQADEELGIAWYLLGINWLRRNHWERAAQALDVALERRLVLPRVERAAWRARMRAACLLGESNKLSRALTRYLESNPRRARSWGAQRFVKRCQASWTGAEPGYD